MKFKVWLASILLVSVATHCCAQEYRNTVFAELLGSGYLYSVNYEREFKNQFVGRIGISAFDGNLLLPVMVGKYFGRKSHHFEFSAGIDFVNYPTSDESRDSGVLLTGFLGYRFQKQDNRFQFRIGFTPLYNPSGDSVIEFIASGGVSFGYRF